MPVAVNTQLGAGDFAFMLADSRARAVVVSAPVLPAMAAAVATLAEPKAGNHRLRRRARRATARRPARPDLPAAAETAPTHPDEPCFWLYSSGSTGRPKGTVHLHRNLVATADLLCRPGARHRRRRCRVLGGEAVLRLWARQRADLPAGGRRHHHPDGRAAKPGLGLADLARASADDLLRRADPLCGAARRHRIAAPRRAGPAPLRLGRRALAGRDRPPLGAADRGRHPRRHRLDRDAAYFPQQPAGRGALRHDRQAARGLRSQDRRRGRPPGAARRDRRSPGRGPLQCRLLLEQSRAQPGDLSRLVDLDRRQILRGRGRLFRLLRAQRRHAEGERACGSRRPRSRRR